MAELRLDIIDADVYTTPGDAIFLPFDGDIAGTVSGERLTRQLGRLARGFLTRYPEIDFVDEIESQVSFPVPLGRVAEVELPPGTPFRWALLLSMHPHDAARTNVEAVRAGIRAALSAAVDRCGGLGVARAVTPLLKGGWRVPDARAAMSVMLTGLTSVAPRHDLELVVCVQGEPGGAGVLREAARSYGFFRS